MQEIGLIGFGNFGRFMTPYLQPYFALTVYDASDITAAAAQLGVSNSTLEETASRRIVIFAVPAQHLAEVLTECRAFIRPDALVLDVASVKLRPLELLRQHLPETTEILGTHPLFGPQSGYDGIRGLNLVLCPVRTSRAEAVAAFCRRAWGLNVIFRTPAEHDRRMAYVQALTHFIGRALKRMEIPDGEQKTVAYQSLLNLKNNLGGDSWDLFLTIEQENPFAHEVRESFLTELHKLHEMLSGSGQ